ncbi:MAG: LicD family protein [Bacteroidales bacterium]|nr:LicD family protein [Bacteroidales bacterium]
MSEVNSKQTFDREAYKQGLIRTLSAFDRYCRDNQLTYMVAYGTCIGAIRHHGMIPWDDDIDVFMFRRDYDRLVSMRSQLPEGYALVQMGENGYCAPIPKFYDTRTTLWEEKSWPCIIGVYLDIFILDECEGDSEEYVALLEQYQKAYLNYMASQRQWTWADIWDKALHLHPLGLIRLLRNKLYDRHRSAQYLQESKRVYERFMQMSGDYLIPLDCPYKAIHPKSMFEGVKMVDFDGMQVPVPSGYDAYLRQLYRDYMQFPPENKRNSTHSHFYLNMDRGMTLEEVKQELGMK